MPWGVSISPTLPQGVSLINRKRKAMGAIIYLEFFQRAKIRQKRAFFKAFSVFQKSSLTDLKNAQ